MKYAIYIAFLALPFFAFGETNDPNVIRHQFIKATQNEDSRASLAEQLSQSEGLDPVIRKAYLGATKTLLAETYFSPWSKYSQFVDGKNLLEEAISQDPDNVEYRYLRFLIQIKAPSFLGYDEHLQQDYLAIKQAMSISSERDLWLQHFKAFEAEHATLIQERIGKQY